MKSNSQSDCLGDQLMPGPFRLRPNMTKGPKDEVVLNLYFFNLVVEDEECLKLMMKAMLGGDVLNATKVRFYINVKLVNQVMRQITHRLILWTH